MKLSNPILGLSILATMIALAGVGKEKGEPIYRRLVDLTQQIKKEEAK